MKFDIFLSVIDWFTANFMVLNADKCHFLLSKPKTAVQQKYIEVGGQVIWESSEEILLGVSVETNLTFKSNIEKINKISKQTCLVILLQSGYS